MSKVTDLNFKALSAFLPTLSATQRAVLDAPIGLKLVVELTITDPNNLNVKEFGAWLKLRETHSVNVEYRVISVVDPRLMLESLMQLR